MYLAVVNHQSDPTATQIASVTMTKLTVFYNLEQPIPLQSFTIIIEGAVQ